MQAEEVSQTDDLLDVLHLVHPPAATYASTFRDELRPHASRILGNTKISGLNYGNVFILSGHFIPRADFLSLLTLLLSIQLDEGIPGASCPSARFPDDLNENLAERLANVIVQRFAPDEHSNVNCYIFKDLLSYYLVSHLKFPK